MESLTGYLILRRRPLDAETLAEHARRLGSEAGLDAYTARLKVLGQGLVSLRSGRPADLESTRRVASRLGYDCFIAQESPPRQEPNLVRRLLPEQERLGFETRGGVFHLPKDGGALLVIGDLSKRLTSKFTNRAQMNPGQPAALAPEEQYKTILTARPLLDVYLFDADGRPNLDEPPLRIEPGKFDGENLVGDKFIGTPQLIDRLVRTIKSYCRTLHFDLNYGLSSLPGITFEGNETPQAFETNAEALTGYGWYLRQLILAQVESGARADFVTGNDTPQGQAAPPPKAGLPFGYDPANYKPKASLPPPPAAQSSSGAVFIGGASSRSLPKGLALPGVFVVLCFVSAVLAGKGFPQLLNLFTYRGILFALIAAYCLHAGFRSLWVKRLIENTPTAKARSLAAGYVELHGTAERACNLLSPVSGLACVYYRLRRYRKQHGKNGDTWVLESEITCGNVPFYLRDETGRILVKPNGAQIVPTSTETYIGDGDSGAGIFGSLMHGGGGTKTIEEVIPELSTLCVWGYAVPTRQTETPWRRRLAERLKGLKQDRSRLMRYDADGNGVIDDDEWRTAVDETEKETAAELLHEQDATKVENDLTIEAPADRNLPFIISGKDEARTSRGYAWAMALSFVAALAFLVAALWLFDYTAVNDLGSRMNPTFTR